ncbi:MAG: DNA mismatch repair endonuclease MutL [Deltaproteobacteria bacterium]|uniref:DNA mismatch repair endonuclease MutL n=1 Tax=Desulfobacula sp. TaxID=2593537 RepID=UPI0019C97982|nr:DNA mismatch repair endonuclease MutL [Candidatus Desulfobacula maris]MBL6995009.1 DNA mismatch repair endonuclease MutL [Desulfobacula sp.]
MTTIRILPEILSNQIAAGEVVQRPSSIVKELVENSIDASATSISVEIEKGGKSLIRISDNGCGLSRDDALLSIERYATSKIFTKQDLFSISTMGFRGEALPSIASVSKFTLVTRTIESDIGTKIDIVGGKIRDVSDAGAPVGTMVEVKNLFFNTPARKKFLKSDNTETSHIADMISGMALGNSHIQFRLFLNKNLTKNFSLSDDLFQRSINVLGKDVSKNLYKIKFSDDFMELNGFAVDPKVCRSSSSKIFLFVNNRLIYDRGLVSAIFQGYKGRLMKGKFPLAVLFVQIPFDQVDVNVHPTKREIKFFNPQQVYQTVAQEIGKTLLNTQENFSGPLKSRAVENRSQDLYQGSTKESVKDFFHKVEQSVFEWGIGSSSNQAQKEKGIEQKAGSTPPSVCSFLEPNTLKILGQAMGTYILAESEAGLMMIDQHAAHERIVYESLKKRYLSLEVISQTLMVPEILELNFKESDILVDISRDLTGLGIIMEPFGKNTFVIKSIPSIIDEKEVKPIIIEIIEKILKDKNDYSKENWLDECLILMSCHSAVRANKPMNIKEMEKLLEDLEKCDNPMHCPHGRPTRVTMKRSEMEKLFKRVV